MRVTRILFALLIFTATAKAQQKTEHITVGGLNREFITYIPSGAAQSNNMPVVISLHGRLGKAEGQLKFADFRPIADRGKVIIVCPQGIDRSWNDGRPGTPADKKGVNDVEFIDSLISYIIHTYHADRTRIYVTGMSNGGFMSSRLAIDLNKRIAAVAVVAATMDKSTAFKAGTVMPIMYIQGTKAPLVPFEGGLLRKGASGDIYGHEDMLKKWAIANHCSSTPVVTDLPQKVDDGTSLIKEEYTSQGGMKVIGYTIVNGGHTWPDGSQYLPKMMVGTVSHNLDACEVIWDFFKNYHR